MALRHIVKYPDSVLRQTSTGVAKSQLPSPEIKQLVADMIDTMYAHNGAGLAAIQIGRLERIFVIDGHVATGNEKDPPVAFINPQIEWLSDETETGDEGCLSFPGIYVPVKRSLRARVSADDLEGRRFTVEAEGLYARALQHEYDHLDGKLIVDFVGAVKREIIKRKMRRVIAEEEAEAAEEGASAGEAL